MRAIDKIEGWLEGRGYTLEPGNHYGCYRDGRVIIYRPKDPHQTMIGGLLHECGHVLVGASIERPSVSPRYKRGYPHRLTERARPNVSAADLIHDELEAWHRGYALAKRLAIRLDEQRYWRDYGYCIKHYFRRLLARKV